MSPNGSWKSWALVGLAAILMALSGVVWAYIASDLRTVRQVEIDVAVIKQRLASIEQMLSEALARKP